MKYYLSVLTALENYFHVKYWKQLFLEGGCYWLANLLHKGISGSFLMISRIQEHCGVFFDNGLYDVSGKISAKSFYRAGDRDICFMKKNYRPSFDVVRLEKYLKECALL